MPEQLTDDDSAPIHISEDGRAAAILFVGSTTEPSPGATLPAWWGGPVDYAWEIDWLRSRDQGCPESAAG